MSDSVINQVKPTSGYEMFGLLQSTNDRQYGIRTAFAAYADDTNPHLAGNALTATIRDDITAIQMVHPDIACNPEIYKCLRRFLEIKGVQCSPTEESGRLIPRQVLWYIYGTDETEEFKRAMAMYDAIRRGEDVV
ncbi:unnamed protein product [Agarophyton chilense]